MAPQDRAALRIYPWREKCFPYLQAPQFIDGVIILNSKFSLTIYSYYFLHKNKVGNNLVLEDVNLNIYPFIVLKNTFLSLKFQISSI